MLKEFSKKATNRYELVISIDADSFKEAIIKAYKQNGKKINVPGFRKGKAPMSIIEKYYGESVFFEDALNILYPEAVESAIAESKLDYVDDKIDFDLTSISRENGVEFKVVITVKPEVEIDGYKGLKAEKVKAVVTDEEIEAEVAAVAERNSRMITVSDRAVENGDTAVIDYEGFVDGVAFDGGKGESYSLLIGSNSFIPGFEDQIIGHNTDEEFDVNVTFPEEYHAAELAGKPAVFKVKLHEIKVKELPTVDDEFAKDVSEFDTLAEYKADLKEKAIARKVKQSEADVENQLVEQLIELVKAEIPEAMIERRAEQSVEEFAYRLQSQGLDMQTYLKYMGGSIEDFKKTFIPQAEAQVKIRLGLEKIAELEKIVPTEDELNAEFEKMAKDYGLEVDVVKASVPATELAKDLAVQKAMDIVKDTAVLTEVDKRTEKTEEKKPAAKKTSAAKKTTAKKAEGDAEAKPAAKKASTTAKKTTTKKAEGDAEVKPAAKKTTTTAAKKTTTKKAEGDTEAKPAAKKTTTKKTTAKKDAE
ncbi:MAG: trigger factor [Ruminococcaceae bacterium]|nr:trigger factor [Oscillospiraceae bacterium]